MYQGVAGSWSDGRRGNISNHGGNATRWGNHSSYTIDTFSLSIVLSLSKHPLYASGRKYAVYRWRKSAPDQKASNLVQPEVTHYGKEEDAPSVDSASGTDLSPRSRRADRQSLRTRPANHPIKASPKNRRGGKSK